LEDGVGERERAREARGQDICGVVVFGRACARLAVSEGMGQQQAGIGPQRGAAGHGLHQQLDAVAADVAVGLRDGGQRGRQVFAQRDAVEADHAQVVGHGQAAEVRGADAADGQQVVRADQRGGAVACLQLGAQGIDGGLDEGHLDQRGSLEAGLGHAPLVAAVALLRAVRRGQRAADHRDAAVPQQHQARDRIGHGAFAVHRHAGVVGVAVVGQHVGHAGGLQAGQGGRGGRVRHDQDEAVDIARQQQVHGAFFLVEPVAGGDGNDGVAARHCGARNALQALGKGRVQQRGQHHAEHAAALGAQGARAGVGQVVELARHAFHQLARGGRDLVGEVEGPRHGGHGDPGFGCYGLDAHRAVFM
jgi:hypothetical protein